MCLRFHVAIYLYLSPEHLRSQAMLMCLLFYLPFHSRETHLYQNCIVIFYVVCWQKLFQTHNGSCWLTLCLRCKGFSRAPTYRPNERRNFSTDTPVSDYLVLNGCVRSVDIRPRRSFTSSPLALDFIVLSRPPAPPLLSAYWSASGCGLMTALCLLVTYKHMYKHTYTPVHNPTWHQNLVYNRFLSAAQPTEKTCLVAR